MKKFVFIILISIFAFVGCTSNEKKEAPISKSEIIISKTVMMPFSNPVIIYGSDFMSFMQSLRKTGKYDMLLQFTYSKSIDEFGKEKVISYYEKSFTNMSKLKLQSIVNNSDGSKTMNYTNLSVATKSVACVDVIVENDSCKLILNDLSKKILN